MNQVITLWALPKGEMERYMEVLISETCQNEADIERIKARAARDGYHSFRVAKINLDEPPNFAAAVEPFAEIKTFQKRQRAKSRVARTAIVEHRCDTCKFAASGALNDSIVMRMIDNHERSNVGHIVRIISGRKG